MYITYEVQEATKGRAVYRLWWCSFCADQLRDEMVYASGKDDASEE